MPLYIYTDIHSDFTPNAVQPIECLKAGWELIKDQYWLFMGVTLVALLIGQLAPFGILMAPMMCGIYLVLFQRLLGRQVEPGGLAFWSGLLDQGVPRFQVVLDIEASLEYQTDLVQEMYQRFLHRDADPVGQTVFVTALRAGVSQEDVAATIVSFA